jgi:hypothetical protein
VNWFKKFWKALTEPTPKNEAVEETEGQRLRQTQGEPTPRNEAVVETTSNFTPRAQQVLALARREADRLNHNFLGTEHLLLGLFKLGQGVAVNVLGKMGLNLETVRMEIEKQVPMGPDKKMIGNIPYTPRVKKVIALADKERRKLNHTYLGTEHLLLGLLLEGDGVAARVMKHLGADVEQTRREILKELDPNFSAQSHDETKNLTPKETTLMPSRFDLPQKPEPDQPKQDSIDTSKRYDVYCTERNQEIVVYRNAQFIGIKRLYQTAQYDIMSQFIELEQAEGQTIFLARSSVIKFCEHGVTPGAETISTKKPPG